MRRAVFANVGAGDRVREEEDMMWMKMVYFLLSLTGVAVFVLLLRRASNKRGPRPGALRGDVEAR